MSVVWVKTLIKMCHLLAMIELWWQSAWCVGERDCQRCEAAAQWAVLCCCSEEVCVHIWQKRPGSSLSEGTSWAQQSWSNISTLPGNAAVMLHQPPLRWYHLAVQSHCIIANEPLPGSCGSQLKLVYAFATSSCVGSGHASTTALHRWCCFAWVYIPILPFFPTSV